MKKSRFTMIELMVVIAIIMILISMLHPALDRTIKHSNELACKTNLKEMVLTLQGYTEDFDQVLPPSSINGNQGLWMTKLNHFREGGKESRLHKWNPLGTIFECAPAVKRSEQV